jgi:nitrite reductase/ring-hydroxylating ferredoxin subunit
MTHSPTRRTILLATGAATLTVGCAEYGDENNDSGSSSVEAGTELARTSEIPVGGGKIFKDEKVVVTQPKQGEFKAFSNICTHQGCQVTSVSGSKFNITDGSVANPPADQPLPEKQIKVTGDSIELA